jgi:hypothetical protein
MKLIQIFNSKFKKDTLSKHNVRVFESNILYPVYDHKRNIKNIISLNSIDYDQEEDKNLLIYTNDFLNININNNIDQNKSHVLYITDSILNLLALHENVSSSAIILKSIESLDHFVSYLFHSIV